MDKPPPPCLTTSTSNVSLLLVTSLLDDHMSSFLASLVSSRYYLKNNMETETLCSDEDAQDLLRESQISLLQLSTMEVAAQLSMRDFELFRNIESTEYGAVGAHETPSLSICVFIETFFDLQVRGRPVQTGLVGREQQPEAV